MLFRSKGKREMSLTGYLASRRPVEWKNLISAIKARIQTLGGLGDEKDKIISAIEASLLSVNENSDIYEIISQISAMSSNDDLKQLLVGMLDAWMAQVYPSNYSAIEAMHQEQIKRHLYVSSQSADREYFQSVRGISRKYKSLNVAFEALSQVTNRTAQEETFVKAYPRYKKIADSQHQFIFNEVFYWSVYIDKMKNGKIENMGPIGAFTAALGAEIDQPVINALKQVIGKDIQAEEADKKKIILEEIKIVLSNLDKSSDSEITKTLEKKLKKENLWQVIDATSKADLSGLASLPEEFKTTLRNTLRNVNKETGYLP